MESIAMNAICACRLPPTISLIVQMVANDSPALFKRVSIIIGFAISELRLCAVVLPLKESLG